MAIIYEWVIETMDGEDIADVDHADTYAAAKQAAAQTQEPTCIALVRDADDLRAWAYVKDGKLPERFLDAYQRPVAQVPARFRQEVCRS